MDDQPSEILLRRGRAEVDGDAARVEFERPGARPGDVVSRPSRRSRLRWLFWVLLPLAIIGAAVWYFPRPSTQPTTSGRNQTGAPVPVGLAPVQKADMPVILNQLGTVTPLATVTVKTQINGYLTEVAFQEGQMVKKGDFLAQIDPRSYQVALEQAEGQLAKDQALLKNAQLDLKRYNTLVAQNSIATQTRDTQVATVGEDQAKAKLAQAQIDGARVQPSNPRLTSPIDGVTGIYQLDVGNIIYPSATNNAPNSTNNLSNSTNNALVTVTQIQPIAVIFTLPEAD